MRINNNIAALNAWRNLGISSSGMSGSLEKLSSGYRINRGADDPAGLVISQKLRAQIAGLTQAISNASDAVSMVQTAEGALTEMNTMLNSIRSLAVHAANTSANDVSSIAADQTAVDKAVESIQRIATTTKFAGKFLLDGSATGATIASKAGEGVSVNSIGTLNPDAVSGLLGTDVKQGDVAVVLTGSATYGATSTGVAYSADASSTTVASLTIVGLTSAEIAVSGAMGLNDMIVKINSKFANTSVWASNGAGASLTLAFLGQYGTGAQATINLTGAGASAVGSIMFGVGSVGATLTGANVAGYLSGAVSGDVLKGSGLVLYGEAESDWEGLELELTAAKATGTALNESAGSVFVDKNGSELKFSLTPDASKTDVITYGIANMQTAKLGLGAIAGDSSYAGLNAISANGTYSLATDAEAAVAIIEQAISDVSSQRSQLGSFQKFTLETTINNLGVTKENLTASESRIRDVDMAQEMMEFMKNQILVQAGTAMLAQANQVPTSVLQLLG